MQGIDAIAEGIATAENAADQSQKNSAVLLLFLMGVSLPLNAAYEHLLEQDESAYFAASLKASTDPASAAVAAADYMKYTSDSTAMSQDTAQIDTQVQSQKGLLQNEGQQIGAVYTMMDAPGEMMKALLHCLASVAA